MSAFLKVSKKVGVLFFQNMVIGAGATFGVIIAFQLAHYIDPSIPDVGELFAALDQFFKGH